MIRRVDDTFVSCSGQPLEKITWLPETAPKAVVQLVHGMAEHMGRYDGVARALAARGFLVVGHTHLGHGTRAEVQGHFADEGGWDCLLRDIDALRTETARAYPGVPYFILGHSMGSFLTRCYLLDHASGLTGAVLSGTGYYSKGLVGLGLTLAGAVCAFGGARKPSHFIDRVAFAASNKPFQPSRTAFDWLSREDAEVDKYIADPCCGFPFTGSGYRDLFRGLDRLTKTDQLRRLPKTLPVLFLSGSQDPVGAMGEGMKKVAQEFRDAGMKDVTVRLYEGGRHEMFNETNREEVYGDLAGWLESKLA